MLLPTKKLNGAFRSFVQKVAVSTVSRRELSLHLPPDPLAGPSSPWSPWSTASSKSNQSASKLMAANLYGSFHLHEQPNIAGSDVVARLRESAELANCWHAKLLVHDNVRVGNVRARCSARWRHTSAPADDRHLRHSTNP